MSEEDFLRMCYISQRLFGAGIRYGISSECLFFLSFAASEMRDGFSRDSESQRVVEETFESNPQYKRLYERFSASDPDLTKEQFKSQLATRVGIFRVLYADAVRLGFEGDALTLSAIDENVKWAVAILHSKGADADTSLDKMLGLFFAGSNEGVPSVCLERIDALERRTGVRIRRDNLPYRKQ